MKFRKTSGAVLTCLCLTISGCGGEDLPDGLPDLQPVIVKVIQGGAPLEGASVQLIPQDSSNTWASGGSTDATGVAKIMTHGKYEGAPAGTYKVTVDKFTTDGPAVAADDPDGAPAATSYRHVDPLFSSAESTTAELTVAEGSPTEETIDVGATVKKALPKL
ncbi:carboxypeptidase regulatory-like domain-containing protein [Allorhodopirellula heiligendammensis]|uniref:Carboxypeptidase regulatory-like domain-containing protein n=1 Tax=Allorhodopirellula heiligendammensis TaxID=2714739 RepID=A0A5C6BZ99_9BACT|nr:carboxypeptidase regulatory-like domain-containing protein [Allorhodopirellula heiligendammensis]TWU16254.1 hypothetical protein Poly21_34590 [Allorhodopirellula heiligendammensis]